MPELPLLRLPNASPTDVPGGGRAIPGFRKPNKGRQGEHYGPAFDRLRTVLGRDGAPVELHNDPTALAPERVIVFETAGSVRDFLKAVGKIKGLEFMAELETEFAPDEDFAVTYKKGDKKGQDVPGENVTGRFYLAMPDVRALGELLRLWDRWRNDQRLDRGLAPIGNLFAQLHDLRPWGMQDRVPPETVVLWQREHADNPNRAVRGEIELWFRNNPARRAEVSAAVRAVVEEAGGQILHEATIEDIAYHGLLVDIPSAYARRLIDHEAVKLAIADEVMFIRPQSLIRDGFEIEAAAPEGTIRTDLGAQIGGAPVAALLDGMPLQTHTLLADRLIIDDPDDIQARALVSQRLHGTAMASLILHGDRNGGEEPLVRLLYVRPIMITNGNGREEPEADRLLIDTIHRAILRIKGTEADAGVAPTVFLVNLSMGDLRRPFAGVMSPLARLIDFLTYRYGLLFLVSAGNILNPLEVAGYTSWAAFEQASPMTRERATIQSLDNAKFERTILSPAEALNAVTVGARHHDNITNRQVGINSLDPLQSAMLPNITSGLGLGYRRMIKPELYFPGGREQVRMQASGARLRVVHAMPGRIYGLSSAAPDPEGRGRLDRVALTAGTSPATALATRACIQIFDSLMDVDGGSPFADLPPEHYPLVVKALLVHSARWNDSSELVRAICGPEDTRRHVERADNTCRFVGYGIPDISTVVECSASRATLVGISSLPTDSAEIYRMPLPASLERITDPRSLSITLAWSSPVRSGHQSYRCIKMEAEPDRPLQTLGVTRGRSQPSEPSCKRGTLFHERFEGESAVAFIDDGYLGIRVWCKEDAGPTTEQAIRYAIAVTIESGTALPIYEEIRERLRIRPRP